MTVTNAQERPWRLPAKQMVCINHEREGERERLAFKKLYMEKVLTMFINFTGVNSVAIEGSDRDQLVVIGEGVDSANLLVKEEALLCCFMERGRSEGKTRTGSSEAKQT